MKILAALDLSPASERVMAEARKYAALGDSELWLLHVVPPDPTFVGYEAGPQVVRDQVARNFRREHETLQEHAAALRAAGIKTTALVVQGPTSETVLKEAAKLGAELLVTGSHGHGAMYQMLVGSVSEGIVRGAKCPVLIVPTHGKM